MFPALQTTAPVTSKTARRDTLVSALKMGALACASIAAMWGAFFFFVRFVRAGVGSDGIASIALVIFALSCLLLSVCFIKKRVLVVTTAFLALASPLLLFPDRLQAAPAYELLAGAALAILIAASGASRAKQILKNSLAVKFFHVAKAALPKMTTAVILLATVVTYLSWFKWNAFDAALQERAGRALVRQADPTLRVMIPESSVEQNVGEFFIAVAESELSKARAKFVGRSGSGEEGIFSYDLLPVPQKRKVLLEAAAALKNQAEKLVGPLDEKEKVEDALYRIGSATLAKWYEALSWKPLFGIIVAVLLFSALKSASILVLWLVELVAFLLFKFLIVVNFGRIVLETTRREEIVV